MVALQAHLNPFQMQKRNAENRGQKFLLLSLKSSSEEIFTFFFHCLKMAEIIISLSHPDSRVHEVSEL